jgi:flagellar assembly factor FliW
MELATRQFGKIEFEESSILDFPAGLPGFENKTRFVLLERASWRPLVAIQSIDSPELCFFALPIEAIDPDYQLRITPEDARMLALTAEPVSLAILSAAEHPELGRWTANLLAPLVINKEARRAVQAVRSDSLYSHRHPLDRGSSCS